MTTRTQRLAGVHSKGQMLTLPFRDVWRKVLAGIRWPSWVCLQRPIWTSVLHTKPLYRPSYGGYSGLMMASFLRLEVPRVADNWLRVTRSSHKNSFGLPKATFQHPIRLRLVCNCPMTFETEEFSELRKKRSKCIPCCVTITARTPRRLIRSRQKASPHGYAVMSFRNISSCHRIKRSMIVRQ